MKQDNREPTAELYPVGTLEHMEAEIYNAFGTDHRPAGKKWLYMVLDMAGRILDKDGLIEAITEDDLNQLTEDNFHTARHAAEMVLHLNKYNT